MKRWFTGLLLLGWALCGAGCSQQSAAPGSPTPAGTAATREGGLPTQAQPKLRTLKLYVGPTEITAELAMTFNEIRAGMMFRTNMADNEGMLFVFGAPHRASFWMKNVTLPLSCAYIGQDGQILEIHDMEPGNEKPIEAASSAVQYVLETPRGWFERHKVTVGMPVATGSGSLAQTFGRGARTR